MRDHSACWPYEQLANHDSCSDENQPYEQDSVTVFSRQQRSERSSLDRSLPMCTSLVSCLSRIVKGGIVRGYACEKRSHD